MMRTLWSNSRERMEHFQKRKDGGGSYPESLEILLKELAERNRPTSETAELVAEGSEVKDNFVPTANCIRDTNERQLMTRSGLQRQRCCVCHLHHERAMSAPASVPKLFKTELQQVHHFKVDVNAGDANAACKCYKHQEYQDQHISSVAILLREMQREVNMGQSFESGLYMHYSTNNHPPHLHSADDFDCCFTAFPSW